MRDTGWLGSASGGGPFRPLMARLLLILGSFIYITLLHNSYVDIISDLWAYQGYLYNPQSPDLVARAWLIAILPSLWMPIALERPSQCTYWILYLIVYVPASIIPWYWGQADSRDLLAFGIVLLAVFSLIGIINRMPLLRIATSTPSTFAYWSMIALMSVAFYALINSSFGLKLRFIDPMDGDDVYAVRLEYEEMQSSAAAGRLASYAVSWQSNVINCLLMSHGLVRRKWLALIIGVFGQLLMYGTTSQKAFLYSGVFFVGLLLAMPYVIYQLWAFVAPGLLIVQLWPS